MLTKAEYIYSKYYKQRTAVSILPLAILLISFFYCLPLGRFSIGRFDTDFRIFDFTILIVGLIYTGNSKVTKEISNMLNSKAWFLRWLKVLGVMVVLSILVGVLYSGTSFLLPILIRVYRFLAYLFVPFLVFAVVRTKAHYVYFFKLYFWLIAIVAMVAFVQGLGILPNFWPEIWQAMYSDNEAPVATLSPHHKHIGVIMLTGVCIGVGYLLREKSLILKVLIAVMCLVMFTVPLFAGTRTYLLGFVGVIPAIFIIGKGRVIIPIVLMVLGSVVFLQYSGDAITSRVEKKFDARVTARIEKLGYEGLYRERTVIYVDIFRAIIESPFVLITGTGFQNIHRFIGANGAHNNFLQVLMELGVIGFIAFVSFLIALWKNLRQVSRVTRDADIITISDYTWVALCGIILTMFVGETFWGQAAMFTLAGQLSFLFGLAVSPLYWFFRYGADHAQNQVVSLQEQPVLK